MPMGRKGNKNMTINGSENMVMQDYIGHKVDKRLKKVYDTVTGDHWPSATHCAREIGTRPYNVQRACNGTTKTCMGRHLSYEENVNEVHTNMANSLRHSSARSPELKRKASSLDAIEKDINTIFKQEEEWKEKMSKIASRIARRQRIYNDRLEAAENARSRLVEAEREMEELELLRPNINYEDIFNMVVAHIKHDTDE